MVSKEELKKKDLSLFFSMGLVILDAFMAGLAFYMAYRVLPETKYEEIPPFFRYIPLMLIHIMSVVVTFFFYQLYQRRRAKTHIDEFYVTFAATSVATIMAIAIVAFIYKETINYPRLMVVYTWLLTIITTNVGRFFFLRLQRYIYARGFSRQNVIIIGTDEVGRMILQKIQQSPSLGYRVVGFVDDNAGAEKVLNTPVLGTTDGLSHLVVDLEVDEIIIALPDASHHEVLSIVARCEGRKVSVKVFPNIFQIMATEVSIGDLNGMPLLTVRDTALQGWWLTLKRGMDIIGSSMVIIMLSPLMMLVAVLIKLDSPGPVFYTQERMGLDARPFMMLKFRSMRQDAEKKTGPVWASAGDPRRTRLGSFLRRLSIDETPQFINVLFGDMSLVGPRPERPMFVEQFRKSIPRYMDRHKEKAGLTGWAQVNGLRGDTSIIERTKYDLWYIENWSLLLDVKILLRTVTRVFLDRNAY